MPHYNLSNSQLQKVEISDLPNAFIISNSHLESILLNRNQIGLEFTRQCELSTKAFLEHFRSEITLSISDGLAELMLLSKGLYYWMHNAFAEVFDENLEINFAATKRVKVSSGSVRVEVPYFNFDSPASTLILGDTIASGTTVCEALSCYLKHWPLKRVFVFTIAGSIVGGQSISRFCESHNVELTVAYGLAAFGLGTNGFDLSFLHPDTITSDKYRELSRALYDGKPVSAAGWDFGTQAQAVKKYRMLSWLEAERWGLQNNSCFAEKEPPGTSTLIEKERAAFSS
jgi:hypothetical protein